MAENARARFKRVLLGIPPAYFGIVFSIVWLRVFLPLSPSECLVGVFDAHVLFDIASGVTLLALAFFSKRMTPLVEHRLFLFVCCGTMVLASIVLMAANFTGLNGLHIASALLGGVGSCILLLSWIEFFASFNPLRCILYYCCSRVASELLGLVLEGYVLPYRYGVLVALSLLSLWMLFRAHAQVEITDRPRINSSLKPFPWKPIVFLVFYAFAYSVVAASLGTFPQYPEKLLFALPALIFIVGVLFSNKPLAISIVYSIVCVLMMLALLLPLAFPTLSIRLSATLIELSYSASKILIILILGGLSYRLGVSILWLYGLTSGFSNLAIAAGILFSQNIMTGMNSDAVAIGLTIAVVLASILLATEHGLNANWNLAPRKAADKETADGRKRDSIAEVSALYSLTAREEEILFLIAQKKSIATIANDMFLAQGTVKAHVQHIYQKTGIHSRSELHALLSMD